MHVCVQGICVHLCACMCVCVCVQVHAYVRVCVHVCCVYALISSRMPGVFITLCPHSRTVEYASTPLN